MGYLYATIPSNRDQDTKLHKIVQFSLLVLVKLRVFQTLWQKKIFSTTDTTDEHRLIPITRDYSSVY